MPDGFKTCREFKLQIKIHVLKTTLTFFSFVLFENESYWLYSEYLQLGLKFCYWNFWFCVQKKKLKHKTKWSKISGKNDSWENSVWRLSDANLPEISEIKSTLNPVFKPWDGKQSSFRSTTDSHDLHRPIQMPKHATDTRTENYRL